MSVTIVVIPSPLRIIHSQTEQELSGKHLLQFPAIIRNSCNWKLPFSNQFYCKTEPLSSTFWFISYPCIYVLLHYFWIFSLRPNPKYRLTSWSQPPINHVKFFYKNSNQAWNQTWKKWASFSFNYIAEN